MTISLASSASWRAVAFGVWCSIVASSNFACTADAANPLSVGDPAPEVAEHGSRPELIWTFRQEACLGCSLNPIAAELASLAHRYRHHVAIVAVAVGGETNDDRKLVENFLLQRRVPATTVLTTPRRHARMFGTGRLPSLYLAHDDTVRVAVDLAQGGSLDEKMASFPLRIDELLKNISGLH